MTVTLETLALQIEVNHQELTAGLGKATKQVDRFTKRTENSFRALKTVALGVFGSQFLRAAVNAASAMQQLEARLKTSTGSTMAAGEAMSFLNDMANRQSVDLLSLADGYTRLLPSVKSGAITMQEMRNILGLVNDNMRAFGASAEDAKFIFFGLSQLLGSGIVTMENLKQVTERLPGSLEALAKATNKPLGELIDWVSTGKVTAQMLKGPLLEAFRINEGAAEALGDTYGATVTRMINSFRNLAGELGEAGVLDSLTLLIDTITKLSNIMVRNASVTGEWFDKFVEANPILNTTSQTLIIFNRILTIQEMAADKATKALQRQLDVAEKLGKLGGRDVFFGTQEEAEGFIGPLDRRIRKQQGEGEKGVPGGRIPVPEEKPEEIIGKAFAIENELREKQFLRMQEFHERDVDAFREKLEKEREMFEGHMGSLFKTQTSFAKRFENFDKLSSRNKVATVVGGLKQLTEEGAKHNKKLFDINKAAEIGNTVISTASAMMKAVAQLGPIAGPVAAAGIAAMGAAQIATISSQQFQGGGGGVGGGGASVASAGVTDTAGSSDGGGDRGLNIGISGVDRDALFSGSQVGDLIKVINEEIENGAIIKGVSIV